MLPLNQLLFYSLVCGDKSDYVIDTITVKQDNIIADNPDDNNETPDDNNDVLRAIIT